MKLVDHLVARLVWVVTAYMEKFRQMLHTCKGRSHQAHGKFKTATSSSYGWPLWSVTCLKYMENAVHVHSHVLTSASLKRISMEHTCTSMS